MTLPPPSASYPGGPRPDGYSGGPPTTGYSGGPVADSGGHVPGGYSGGAAPTGTPGSPYTVPGTSPSGSHDGRIPALSGLAGLLVVTSIAVLVWQLVTHFFEFRDGIDGCSPAQGLACLTSPPVYDWLFIPLAALVLSWACASGARAEARQGRARGWAYLIVGIAAVVGIVIGGL